MIFETYDEISNYSNSKNQIEEINELNKEQNNSFKITESNSKNVSKQIKSKNHSTSKQPKTNSTILAKKYNTGKSTSNQRTKIVIQQDGNFQKVPIEETEYKTIKINKIVERLYDNRVALIFEKGKKEKIKPKQINSKPVDLNQMLKRFEEKEKSKQRKLLNSFIEIQTKNNNELQSKPKISSRSHSLIESKFKFTINEDESNGNISPKLYNFFQREKYYIKKKINKIENMKMNKQLEELKSIGFNENFKVNKIPLKELNNKINNLVLWEKKRQDKLNTVRILNSNKDLDECSFQPNANRSSTPSNYISNEKVNEIVSRLYTPKLIDKEGKNQITLANNSNAYIKNKINDNRLASASKSSFKIDNNINEIIYSTNLNQEKNSEVYIKKKKIIN